MARDEPLPSRIVWVGRYLIFSGAVMLGVSVVAAAAFVLAPENVASRLTVAPWRPVLSAVAGVCFIIGGRELAVGRRRGAIFAMVALLPSLVQALMGLSAGLLQPLLHAGALIAIASVWRRLR
jgi:hypothetical protein